MFPVSDAFLAAVRSSHAIVSSAVVLTPPGQTGTSPIGSSLDIVSGSVTLDATADVRGTADLTVSEAWATQNTTNDLVPYGTEIAINRGIVFGNGVVQRVPLGIYQLTDVEQSDAPKGSIRLTLSDRMSAVIRSRLPMPIYFAVGTSYNTIFNRLVNDATDGALPGSTIAWDDTSGTGSGKTLLAGLVCEQDRFGFLNNLITGLGKIWYWDYRGILVIKSLPSAVTPIWNADAGVNGVLVSAARGLTRQNVYNAIVVTGEGLNASIVPPVQTAYDLDPTSVTMWGGPFGKVPDFYSDPSVTDNTSALASANLQLAKAKGLPYNVDFTQIPNPALEPYDPVAIVYPLDLAASPHVKTELHVLQQLVIGLGSSDGMHCTTKLTSNLGVLG